jgi:hypothetical protein
MAEQSFRLQWLVKNVLFQLAESGRLTAMHPCWFAKDYNYAQRAITEGLLSSTSKTIHENEQESAGERDSVNSRLPLIFAESKAGGDHHGFVHRYRHTGICVPVAR